VEAKSPYDDTDYLYEQATRLFKDDERALAHDVARRILILDPGYKNAHKLLAAIYFKNEDYSAALAECKEVSRIDPTDVPSQIGAASALSSLGQQDNATRILEFVFRSQYSNQIEREEAAFRLEQMQQKRALQNAPPPSRMSHELRQQTEQR
jgi:tetratricopeptide (TPR) repeat protein